MAIPTMALACCSTGNLLGDGIHTVSALADGVEFAEGTVIVTTLEAEFLRGVSGTVPLPDFPTPGRALTLRWQQAQQNFVMTDGSPSRGGGTSGQPPRVLENPAPGSFQSGIGLISGWVCEAQTITVHLNDGPPQEAAYGTGRGDTQGVCGDTDNGFGLLFNWNLLGEGTHTVAASADGAEFARVEVTVTTLGREFQRGLSHEVQLPDFPEGGSDIVLRWQQAQQNFVISYAAPTQRLVDVTPTLTLPAGVTAVQRPAVRVTSLGSEAAAVRASPEPSLLFAEDADGTVLLALADRDGGWLGEAPGEVEVSIASTAIVLVALAAGYAIPDIDQAVVDEIVARAQYPALLAALTQLMVADKNFLDRLFAHPEVVALIREVAAFRAAPAQGLLSHTAAVRQDGIIRDDFGADSPWAADAPWQWFGTANLLFLPVQPPFLAQSLTSDRQAAANPNFVDYVLRAYTGDAFQDWYHTPRNADQVDKVDNSGAAPRRLRLAPEIDRVVFTRYRLTLDDAPHGPAYSLLNTFKMVTSVVSLMKNVKAVERWLDGLPPKTVVPQIAACGKELVAAVPLPGSTSGSVGIRELQVILDDAIALRKALLGCAAAPVIDELKRRVREALTEGVLADLAKKLAGPLSWIILAIHALNDTVPVLTSYFAPSAGDAEYYLGWAVSEAGVPYLACVSEDDTCPRLEAPTNLRIESTTETTITLAWDTVEYDAIVEYVVYQHPADGSDPTKVTQTAGLTTTVRGLREGERYCFTVTAVAELESDSSAQICGTPEEGTPTRPTGLTATYSHTAGGINYYIWDWDSVDGAARYELYWIYPSDEDLAIEKTTCSPASWWGPFAQPESPPFTWTHYHGDYIEHQTVCKAVVAVRADGTRTACSEPVCGKWNHPTSPPSSGR